MKVKILKRFVDGRGFLRAPGIADLDDKTAASLITQGRAASVSAAEVKEAEKEAPKTSAATGELPEDFPERERLVEAGFDTLESLREEGAEEEILEIDGIGKGTLKKIQKALEEA